MQPSVTLTASRMEGIYPCRSSVQTARTKYHSPILKVLMFVPLVSSPSEPVTGEYLSRGPRKGRHWAYILLPSPGPRKCQPNGWKG